MDSLGGLPRVVVWTAAGAKYFRGGRELFCMFPETVDCVLRLSGTAGCGDDDEMRGKRSGGEVLVNQALTNAKANTTTVMYVRPKQAKRRASSVPAPAATLLGLSWARTYLLPPVTRTNMVSLAGTPSQGAGAMVVAERAVGSGQW